MLRITAKTKWTPVKVIQKAIDFFGPKGYGLKIVEQTENSLKFEGGDGVVDLSIRSIPGVTEVDLFANQWEFQLKEFIDLMK
jgi:hypothetical protein